MVHSCLTTPAMPFFQYFHSLSSLFAGLEASFLRTIGLEHSWLSPMKSGHSTPSHPSKHLTKLVSSSCATGVCVCVRACVRACECILVYVCLSDAGFSPFLIIDAVISLLLKAFQFVVIFLITMIPCFCFMPVAYVLQWRNATYKSTLISS